MARGFNGSTDFINIAGLTSNAITGGGSATPFSFSAWVNLAAGAGSFPVIFGPASGGIAVFFGINVGSHAGFNLYLAGGQSINNTVPTAGIWYQVVGTYNGNTTTGIAFYVNGTSVGGTQAGTVSMGSSTAAMQIGNGSNGGNSFWKGSIADMAVWNVALTASEAAALAGGARPGKIRPQALLGWWPTDGLESPEPDFGGNAHVGTLTGTTLAAGPPAALLTPRMPRFLSAAVAATAVQRRTLTDLGTRIGSRQMRAA